jgi:hypothetical protein
MNKPLTLKIAFSLMALAITFSGSAAFAQGKSGSDVFNRSTGPSGGGWSANMPISGNAALGNNGPIPRWFDAMDYAFYEYGKVKAEDAITLNANFASNADKLQKWSRTVSSTAKKYHTYARALRGIPVPPGAGQAGPELKSYRDGLADYYDDCADYFEDWIRPRQPAVTRDELKEQLDEMHERSKSLKTQIDYLLTIDNQLRTKYEVRPREDALMQYVAKQPNK